jgi:hypothetical protein
MPHRYYILVDEGTERRAIFLKIRTRKGKEKKGVASERTYVVRVADPKVASVSPWTVLRNWAVLMPRLVVRYCGSQRLVRELFCVRKKKRRRQKK